MAKYLTVFFISMLPLVELRLAVPMAVGMGLPTIPSIVVCTLGNMLPVPFIYMFARGVLTWGSQQKYIGKISTFFLEKGERAGQKLVSRTGRYGMGVALMLFVGIPLPGTGAWTGTLAASLLNTGPKTTAISVSLGVVMAGILMALASTGVFAVLGF